MIVWQTRKFTMHIVKLGKFMLVFWFFTLSMYHTFYSDICKKKKMYWDLNAEESDSPFPHMRKCFMKFQMPLGTYVCVIMSTQLKLNSLIVQGDTGRLPEIKYKIQLFTRSRNLPDLTEQVYFIFLSSADNVCKQFGPRSAPTECLSWSVFYWSWSGSKVFDTLALMFMKKIEKVNFEKKSADGNKCMKNHQVCK